jgi:hypothetical protein
MPGRFMDYKKAPDFLKLFAVGMLFSGLGCPYP